MLLSISQPRPRAVVSALLRRSHPAINSCSWRIQIPCLSFSSLANDDVDDLVEYAIDKVRDYDPAGYLPGRLLGYSDRRMQRSYFAVRSFWIESGLRFGSTAMVASTATPLDHLEWWQQGINAVFEKQNETELPDEWKKHPTLNLLYLMYRRQQEKESATSCCWTKQHFDDILEGRRKDLNVKQYDTLDHLIHHAEQSCGTLSQLVLESGNITLENNPNAHEAARLVGICHGLTMSLRLSIPVLSTTGKLIVPADLCVKYGVKSPRYLLSSLGMGDEQGIQALQHAVQDIAETAQDHLQQARDLRTDILSSQGGKKAVAALLPGLASETFLNRLSQSKYQLTDRNLRNVGTLEHATCAARMILAYGQSKY